MMIKSTVTSAFLHSKDFYTLLTCRSQTVEKKITQAKILQSLRFLHADIDAYGKMHLYKTRSVLSKRTHTVLRIYEFLSGKTYAYMIKNVNIEDPNYKRFLREIEIHQEMKEDCFVRLIYFSISSPKRNLVSIRMCREYCNSGDLFTLRNSLEFREKHLPQFPVLLKDIFMSLTLMRKKGIVHRGIKHNNILLQNENGLLRAKTNDFDASLRLTDIPREYYDGPIGRVGFLSPELCKHTVYSEEMRQKKMQITAMIERFHLLQKQGKEVSVQLKILEEKLSMLTPDLIDANFLPYSYRSDMWATGIMIYDVLNRRYPHFIEEPHGLNYFQFFTMIKDLSDKEIDRSFSDEANQTFYQKKQPQTIEALNRCMLAKDPEQRITPEEALEAITSIISQE